MMLFKAFVISSFVLVDAEVLIFVCSVVFVSRVVFDDLSFFTFGILLNNRIKMVMISATTNTKIGTKISRNFFVLKLSPLNFEINLYIKIYNLY